LDHTFNDIEDFLTDESFRNWVNSPTPELDVYWKSWMEANQTKIDLVNQSRKMIQSLNFKEFQPDSVSKERILQKIRLETKHKRKYPVFLNAWYKVAAILIVVLGIGALLRYYSIEKQQKAPVSVASNLIQKSNPSGVKSKHILPDATIFLNAASSIEYPKTFGADARIVKLLQGEAFFQVVKDVNRPFRVLAKEFEVAVLGTTFNVNANLKSPEVALVEGKVKVTSGQTGHSMELAPGQLAIFDKDQNTFTSTTFVAAYITGWKDGYLTFKDATLDEVVEKLHLWYGIDIAVSNKSKSGDWSYTGNFRNESLENVLLNMSILRNFDYVIKNDSLIISFR